MGLRRPLFRLDLGGSCTRIDTWLEEDMMKELERLFGSVRETVRETLRLGALAVSKKLVEIVRFFGLRHILLTVEYSNLKYEKEKKPLKDLKA